MADALMMLASIVGPLTLAIVDILHPHAHDLFEIGLTRWMAVHYAQIILFPLAAWSQTMLIRGERGYAAGISRVSMFVFAVTYVAFDTAAGVVTGVLVRSALASGAPDAWRSPVLAVWNHPIVGGSSDGAPALAVIGTMAWLLGTLCSAVVIRRAHHSWGPVIFLVISAFGLFVFRSHAWPGGPITFGSLALAVGLVELERRRSGLEAGTAHPQAGWRHSQRSSVC
jgi:hypothetical protein